MQTIAHVRHGQRGQWNIIGSLVVIALLIGLAAWMLPKMLKPGAGQGDDRTAIQDAQGAACSIYTSQINQAVMMYKSDHEGRPPSSLQELSKYGVTSDITEAPGCSFQLGPGGRVYETGHGAAPSNAPHNPMPAPGAPITLGSPSPAPSPAPQPNTQTGPGGIHIPTGQPAGGYGDTGN